MLLKCVAKIYIGGIRGGEGLLPQMKPCEVDTGGVRVCGYPGAVAQVP